MPVSTSEIEATEVFKALGDPIRWDIVKEIAAVDELPCAALEGMLPVSKPTISYHTKILQHAGLLSVRKEGRNYYYALRRDTLQSVIDRVRDVRPGLHAVEHTSSRTHPTPTAERERKAPSRSRRVAGDDDVVVLTW